MDLNRFHELFDPQNRVSYPTSAELGFVYYESMKRELKTRPMYECRCDERLKTKVEESTPNS